MYSNLIVVSHSRGSRVLDGLSALAPSFDKLTCKFEVVAVGLDDFTAVPPGQMAMEALRWGGGRLVPSRGSFVACALLEAVHVHVLMHAQRCMHARH